MHKRNNYISQDNNLLFTETSHAIMPLASETSPKSKQKLRSESHCGTKSFLSQTGLIQFPNEIGTNTLETMSERSKQENYKKRIVSQTEATLHALNKYIKKGDSTKQSMKILSNSFSIGTNEKPPSMTMSKPTSATSRVSG